MFLGPGRASKAPRFRFAFEWSASCKSLLRLIEKDRKPSMTQYLSKRTWGNKNTRLCHAHQSPDLQDFHPCKKEVGCIVATSKVPSQSSEPFAEVREDGHAGGSWQPHKFPGASKTSFEDGKIMHCLCYVVTQCIYIIMYILIVFWGWQRQIH